MTLPKEAPLSAPTLWWGSSPGSLIQYVSNTENDAISATDQTNIRTTKRKQDDYGKKAAGSIRLLQQTLPREGSDAYQILSWAMLESISMPCDVRGQQNIPVKKSLYCIDFGTGV